ncbi:unnamed protein product [Hymenolepis diminuta]|uniref:Integrase catalytic domain-containing protein n=1 Tax=Hymenolepis diminuta TaxID=6216 RepID=A0A564YF62_HYMDI|nr:unnamed protein product [Hymenolepis diminuta]
MSSIHTVATISAIDCIFTPHDFLENLVSENGTQFCSSWLEAYCRHPQSNGQTERFVDAFVQTGPAESKRGVSDGGISSKIPTDLQNDSSSHTEC